MSCAPPAAARGRAHSRSTKSVTKEIASSATETAAALAGRSISICCWMYCETTWVSRGMLPPMSTTEPYSPTARAKASPVPLMIAGARVGSTTRRNVVRFEAPRDAAASSTSRSSSMRTGCTDRTTNGQRDEGQGDDEAPAGGVEVQADRAVGAVEGEQHDARDDRRQGEGEVDERVDDALAGEVVAHEDPGDERAHDGVDHGDDGRDDQSGHREGGERDRRGHRLPEAGEPVVEGADGEGGEGQQHDDAEPQAHDAETRGRARARAAGRRPVR